MYTYKERLKAMRDTKIAHTLQKKEQNGFTDIDDFGTVPLPAGYKVEPWYNSTCGSFYGLDGMSENFCRVMAAHEPYVDPMEMLCGRWMDMLVNYRGDVHYMPLWRQKQIRDAGGDIAGMSNQWSKRWDEQRFPYDHLKPLQKKYNIATGIDGDAHFTRDHSIGLSLGFGGLLEKIRKYRQINPDKTSFYDAEERCVLAIVDFIKRHIQKIEELLAVEKRPELRDNLEKMLRVNKKIMLGKPETFHEVCQWTAYYNCASRVYTRDGSGFQMDTLLWPYYQADRDKGILDDETAKFLIANLLLIDPHYYALSGVDENDRDLTNHLSWLILEAADSINISCNLTVRVHPNCDRAFLEKAVYYLIKNKNGWPRFSNDITLTEGYMNNGVDKKTARQRIPVGCNWMCTPGKEFPMNDTVKINVAKVLEEALKDMRLQEHKSTERLLELFDMHLKKAVEVTAAGVNLHLDHVAEVTPELIMNLLFQGCLEQGLDASQCAQYYTVGVDGAGLAVVADSFGAMQTRIEEQHLLTWEELYAALDNDFADERVYKMLKVVPKYCGGNTVSDHWAKRITDHWVHIIRAQEMPAGRQLVPGWFSWARSIEYGATVGATPNGRRKGEPLSHGANPNPGFRQDGAVTAQSTGIAAVQCGYGNAAPLQLEFDPKVTADETGINAITELILAHFRLGGTLININVLDGEKLLEAHKDPEKHPDLVVRVTGFTAYFASLSPQFRQLVVDRFLQGM